MCMCTVCTSACGSLAIGHEGVFKFVLMRPCSTRIDLFDPIFAVPSFYVVTDRYAFSISSFCTPVPIGPCFKARF